MKYFRIRTHRLCRQLFDSSLKIPIVTLFTVAFDASELELKQKELNVRLVTTWTLPQTVSKIV